MTKKVYVTDVQVAAAQMIVERDRALGRESDPAILKIAEAAAATGGAANAAHPVAIDPGQVRSLNEQVDRLDPGEPYMAVVAGGQVFVRATSGLPETLIQLWRRNPAMMIPDSAGYQPETCESATDDL